MDCFCLESPGKRLLLWRNTFRHCWLIVTEIFWLGVSSLGWMSRLIFFCIRFRFVGCNLLPIHSCDLDITIILCNSVPSIYSVSDLPRLFNVAMTRAPKWRPWNISSHNLALLSNMRIFLVRWSSPPTSVYLTSSLLRLLTGCFLVKYAYFWWGYHCCRLLIPV